MKGAGKGKQFFHRGPAMPDSFFEEEQTGDKGGGTVDRVDEFKELHKFQKKVPEVFADFIKTEREGEHFIYREQLKNNLQCGRYCLEVSLDKLEKSEHENAHMLLWGLGQQPACYIKLCENALRTTVYRDLIDRNAG